MRNPHGYAVIFDPDLRGGVEEHDTITCPHCGSIGMTKSSSTGRLEVLIFRADGSHYLKECGFCRSCMEPVCPRCDGKPCDNRHRRIDAMEALAHKLICKEV